MKKSNTIGHLLSLFTVLIWGTTFISTKVLLIDFQPVEILFFRFIIGLAALSIACPHRFKAKDKKHEIYFAFAGLSGITLYFLFENIALTYTLASNVGVIVSAAPIFTAILTYFFMKEEKLRLHFFIGFVIAMAGVSLISFNGSRLQLNPAGDILALLAAVVWAVYSLLIKKIGGFGYSIIQATKHTFGYGILFMIPALFLLDFKIGPERFADPVNLFNILYLGLGASALCFATWNYAVKILGAIKTSVYIYMVPLVTVIMSIVILHEEITPMAVSGIFLILIGLVISEGRRKR